MKAIEVLQNKGMYGYCREREEAYYEEDEILEAMIDFAKFHVQKALRQAAMQAVVIKDLGENEEGVFNVEKQKYFYDEMGYPMYVDTESILSAYLLDNIN